MKRTYITPAVLTVELSGRDALLQSMSAGTDLTSGGSTGEEGVTEADARESKNIWSDEW